MAEWRQIRDRWNGVRPTLRWTSYAVLIGYVPIFTLGFLPGNRDELAGFGLGWGLWITIPCTFIAAALILFELVRMIFGRSDTTD